MPSGRVLSKQEKAFLQKYKEDINHLSKTNS